MLTNIYVYQIIRINFFSRKIEIFPYTLQTPKKSLVIAEFTWTQSSSMRYNESLKRAKTPGSRRLGTQIWLAHEY